MCDGLGRENGIVRGTNECASGVKWRVRCNTKWAWIEWWYGIQSSKHSERRVKVTCACDVHTRC